MSHEQIIVGRIYPGYAKGAPVNLNVINPILPRGEE
jgi:hypothetical protein